MTKWDVKTDKNFQGREDGWIMDLLVRKWPEEI